MVVDFPWEMPPPRIAPEWIIGPSLPTGSCPPTEQSTPTILQMSVFMRIARGTLIPFNVHCACVCVCVCEREMGVGRGEV